MTALKPGLWKATVRGVPDTIVMAIAGDGLTSSEVGGLVWHRAEYITDARPLIVLELQGRHCTLAADLRKYGWPSVADQIEAQTKPPRIPEPEDIGTVRRATSRSHPAGNVLWTKYTTGKPVNWINEYGTVRGWDDLIDPQPYHQKAAS